MNAVITIPAHPAIARGSNIPLEGISGLAMNCRTSGEPTVWTCELTIGADGGKLYVVSDPIMRKTRDIKNPAMMEYPPDSIIARLLTYGLFGELIMPIEPIPRGFGMNKGSGYCMPFFFIATYLAASLPARITESGSM